MVNLIVSPTMLFHFNDKALVLRFSRLGRIPPALFATQLLAEEGMPVAVVEYGEDSNCAAVDSAGMLKVRLGSALLARLPHVFRLPLTLLFVFFSLSLSFLVHGRPRFLVAHGPSEGFLVWLLQLVFRIPYVIHAHEVYDWVDAKGLANRFFLMMEPRVFRGAQFLLFPEKKRSEIYRERYGFTSPVFLVANAPRLFSAVAPIDLKARCLLPKDAVVMGYFGGIGPDNLLELAIQALPSLPTLHFLVWGWGDKAYLESLSALALEKGVSDRFFLLGELSDRKWETIAGLDISYCLYRPEILRLKHAATASNKLFEAMSVSVPSLTSCNPDFLAFLDRYPVALAVPGISVQGVTRALQKMVDEPNLRSRLGQNGRCLFETDFHYEHQFSRAKAAFQSLYEGNSELFLPGHLYLPSGETLRP